MDAESARVMPPTSVHGDKAFAPGHESPEGKDPAVDENGSQVPCRPWDAIQKRSSGLLVGSVGGDVAGRDGVQRPARHAGEAP